jgi:hypothetical protein
MKHYLIFLLLYCIIPLIGYCQEDIKYEKEIVIDSNLAPLKARIFTQSLNVEILNWVKEINFTSKSYETKAIWNNLPVSIEFDSTGVLEDIEISIEENKIPTSAIKRTHQVLHQHFVKFNLAKVQLQLTGNHLELIKRMVQNDEQTQVTHKYEIELYGKIKTAWRMYEYIFDQNGMLEQKREISGIIHQYESF